MKNKNVQRYNLPPNFVFGAATAAYQIEGNTQADGRGASIWEPYFDARPHLDNGKIACDHYNPQRMQEDVALLRALTRPGDRGSGAYRFSSAWPRIQPSGRGAINSAGLEFYDRLIESLLEAGIDPYLTLYHWDLPQALQDKGGWQNLDTGKYFADYAEIMVRRYSDRVKKWTTLNEPEVIVAGYIGDGLAPGLSDPTSGAQVAHNLLVAHGRAMQAIRSAGAQHTGEQRLSAGMVLNLVPCDPLNAEAGGAARKRWDNDYGKYLDAMLTGAYPETVLKDNVHGPLIIQPGDMDLIAQPLDYLGVNYYLRLVIDASGNSVPVPDAEVTQMGWEIHPQSLSKMLVELNDKYRLAKQPLPPVYITENGAALDDNIVDGQIHDYGRIKFLHEHLLALEDACTQGVDLRGYFVWSLMDNLEWSLGFSKTFGLIHVNRQTLKRTVKDSGWWYRDVIRANR